jgi:hypothetical protein
MPNTTQTNKTQAAKKPRAQRNKAKEPEQAKTKLARSAYLSKKAQQKLQTKMDVSTPGDAHEQEADRVAEEVSRMPRGVARKASEKQSVAPGSSKPDNHAADEQSLQTKISRVSDDAETANRLARETDETAERQAKPEEQVATKISRAGDDEMADRAATNETAEQAALETGQNENDAADGESAPMVSDETEQQINALKGQGKAMDESIRKEMEAKMNADFSDVSIHTSGEADALCKQLSARAVTVGNDIFFAAGEYAPDSEAGRKLLAHELTHVVQQESGASRKVYRAGVLTNKYTNQRWGSIDTGPAKEICIKGLKVPNFKHSFYKAAKPSEKTITWRRNASTGGEKRDTGQITKWENGVKKEADEKVSGKLGDKRHQAHRTEVNGKYIYYFKYKTGNSFLFGEEKTIKERCRRPVWRSNGEPASFHVDHQIEYQTGGLDELSNMWLLDGPINVQSGREIRTEIRTKVGAFIDNIQDKVLDPPKNIDDARTNFTVYFNPVQKGLGSYGNVNAKKQYYTQAHIKNGDHLRGLEPMSEPEITKSGLLSGNAENITIFPSAHGGYRYQLTKDQGANTYSLSTRTIAGQKAQNFDIRSVTFDAQSKTGTISLRVPSQALAKRIPNCPAAVDLAPIPIQPMDGIEWGGKFDRDALKRNVRDTLDTFPALSPLKITNVDVNAGGISMAGTITPTLPLISNAAVNFSLDGETLSVYKTFTSEEFKVPSPLKLGNNFLTLGISNRGLFVSGGVNFGIDKVGEGNIRAAGKANFDSSTSLSLEGEFNFDERIFGKGKNARVTVGYNNEQWSMGGSITIPKGKVPGIQTATIEVNYSEADGFSASGDATLNVPGVESGTLSITQSKEKGFSIGGKFKLSADTPGIRGGSIEASVTEKPDGSGYAVSATGEAQPDIPGVNSNLIVSYNDGAFTAEIEADYSRGMLSGKAKVGVTNRSVGEDGQLSETAEEGNPLIVYGGGQLKLQLAPWLQGTAGVKFSPAGELTVVGEIGLPDELEIFRRYKFNKDIFSISVKAPIFPGIVAEIGGDLSAQAGIGPGVIDQLKLGVTYNPDHEENTQITGDAHLNIPADAGLRLSVQAGIGLGITGASATGGLEIGGTLGITGAAEASVRIEWTPSKGLAIDANVGIHAQPSFTFDIGGYVKVKAFWYTVYSKHWKFASYTFGSDYRFGISLPIHYREDEPFDISLDDVKFEVPDINTNKLLRGLIDRIS